MLSQKDKENCNRLVTTSENVTFSMFLGRCDLVFELTGINIALVCFNFNHMQEDTFLPNFVYICRETADKSRRGKKKIKKQINRKKHNNYFQNQNKTAWLTVCAQRACLDRESNPGRLNHRASTLTIRPHVST